MNAYFHRGLRLYLGEGVDWGSYFRLRKGEGADVEGERAALGEILETAARICQKASSPSCARAGSSRRASKGGMWSTPPTSRRRTAPSPRPASLSFSVEEQYGGFGLPAMVTNMLLQMVARADAGLMTLIGLQTGVAEDIQVYASEDQMQAALPAALCQRRADGRDGSDRARGRLGPRGITTRATESEGRIRLDGSKIFITNGGAEIHLVLARDADDFDASKGTTRGLSLFLCPRTLPDGRRNGVRVVRLEDKLGIHGSPTAAVVFEGALAYRMGVKGEGFKAMLTLMNNARLGVAAQGIGIAEGRCGRRRYGGSERQFADGQLDNRS